MIAISNMDNVIQLFLGYDTPAISSERLLVFQRSSSSNRDADGNFNISLWSTTLTTLSAMRFRPLLIEGGVVAAQRAAVSSLSLAARVGKDTASLTKKMAETTESSLLIISNDKKK